MALCFWQSLCFATKQVRFTCLFLPMTSLFFVYNHVVLRWLEIIIDLKRFDNVVFNILHNEPESGCLSSNQLGHILPKTCRFVRETYCMTRQSISAWHFLYISNDELSHIINASVGYPTICLRLQFGQTHLLPFSYDSDTWENLSSSLVLKIPTILTQKME